MNSESRTIVVLRMLGLDGADEPTLMTQMERVEALDAMMTGGPGRARNAGFVPCLDLHSADFAKAGTLLAERLIELELESPEDAARVGIAYACAADVGLQYAKRGDSDIAQAVRAAFGRDPTLDEFNESLGAIGVGIADEHLAGSLDELQRLARDVMNVLGEAAAGRGYASVDAIAELAEA